MEGAKRTKHLMLDLDETLICSKPLFTTLPKISVTIRDSDGELCGSIPNLVMRPHLVEFLKAMKPHYDINLFTAAESPYAESILNRTGLRGYFSNVYTRDDCSYVGGSHYKDLSKLPYEAKDTILLDDMTHHLSNQSDQILLVTPFTGNALDTELLRLIPFLTELSKCKDLRPVSTRHIYFLQDGTVHNKDRKKTFHRQLSHNAKLTRNSESKRKSSNSPRNATPTNRKSEKPRKKSVDDHQPTSPSKYKTFVRSYTSGGKAPVASQIQQIQQPVPSGFLKKYQEVQAENKSNVRSTEPYKENSETDSSSESGDECNVGSESELPPSDNPTVTRHLGPRKLRLRFSALKS